MKVSTPSISWHNRERISSIDFQSSPWPNDKYLRLASGGDDKHVVIWDWKESLNCLADLNRHQNSVNTLRWSKDGKILASGDTDSAIYLWHFQEISLAPDLFGDELPEDDSAGENWSVLKILRGHLQDVVSLDWSSCGNYIISSSTDNTAIIFDVQKGTKLKILSEHKGWVNGVAFDPLGKYVASICSDRSLRVYSTKSYKTISKTAKCRLLLPNESGVREEKGVRLFHDDTFQSFYRRLDFSPDGQLLAVPSGVLEIEQEASISHCTYIFTSANFSKPVLYLPNKEFSVAVRFCPVLFELRPVLRDDAKRTEKEKGEEPWEKYKTTFALPYRMIYAVATQNTVMFYDTQKSTPFARVSKIHYIGLTDLSWTPDGRTCIVSSTDGYASFIEFQEGELGKVYTPIKKSAGLEEISVNVPIKSSSMPKNGNSVPLSKSAQKTSEPSLISVRKASKDVPEKPKETIQLPLQVIAARKVDDKSKKKESIAQVIASRKAPKESALEGSRKVPPPEEKSSKEPAAPVQVIAIRKALDPKEECKKEAVAQAIASRKAPKSSKEDDKSKRKDSVVQVIATRKAPKNSAPKAEEKRYLPKPIFEEPVSTPPSSSTTNLPFKSPKRVQLVTLSIPEKEEELQTVEEEADEEEEGLSLFLEDESPHQ